MFVSGVAPFIDVPGGRRPRVAVFLSGSGTNAEKILQGWRGRPDAPYTVAVLVTDAPERSRARELGTTYGVPVVAEDIRAWYRTHGLKRVSLATPEGRRLREEWTDRLRQRLAPFEIDFGVLAGFVPLTNLVGDFPCLNVHPGDLTYLKDGRRYLVGLHTVPIERAILEGLDSLRSSVIQALPYTGSGEDMDSGPILGVSAPVPVDLDGATLDELRACAAARSGKRPPGGWNDRLEQVALLNQERLKREGDWVVLPGVVDDVARGLFGRTPDGGIAFRVQGRWHRIETVVYHPDGAREVLFRAPDRAD